MLSTLAKTDLETAVQWGIGNPDAFGADAIRDLFVVYSKSDSQGLERALSQINDPRARASAIEALAARRVMNTEAALEWADSLPTSEEQSLAHDAIYEMTPRGIGVSVFSKDGFPEVGKVVRSENGLQRGDRIASISENGAEPVDTFGRSLGDIVDILRGEPGTTVTIQLLRSDSTSAEVQQVEKTIIREQLYFE
jgi:C-terminal processing protease CtpA/Prc